MNNNIIYNTIGKTYDATRKPDSEILEKFVELLRCKSDGRYLDIGCGSGNYTGALAQKGVHIEGIDISAEMLSKARKKYPQIFFQQGDATALPFQDDVFDGAICMLATHHINNNKKFSQEAFRIIKSGRLVIFTATPEQMKNYWLCHYFPEMMRNAMEKMSAAHMIKDVLEQAGFTHIQQTPFLLLMHCRIVFCRQENIARKFILIPL
jgi:ubiquinone/menaquinone biosynthesis C-methylase UbiE